MLRCYETFRRLYSRCHDDYQLICPLYQELIWNLENKFIELNSTKVVFPKHETSLGNSVILPKSYFDILTNLVADEGARSQIKNKDYKSC